MTDKNHRSSEIDSHALPTDEQLSSLYEQSLQGINTNPETDRALMALAQQKAQSVRQGHRTSGAPFFGSDLLRSWTSAAAFGVMGICVWVTLQAPLDVFQEASNTAPEWESSHGVDTLSIEEEVSTVSSESPLMGHDAPLMAEQESNLEADEYKPTLSKPTLSKQTLSTPVGSELRVEESTTIGVPMTSVPQSLSSAEHSIEIQRLRKEEAIKAKRQAQQRKSVVRDEIVQEKRRSVSPLLSQPTSIETLPSARQLPEAQAEDVVSDVVETQSNADESMVLSPTFDENLTRLQKLIDDENWSESRDLLQQLIEEYEGISIPAEIIERFEDLQKKVGDTDNELKSPGKANLPSDLPSLSD